MDESPGRFPPPPEGTPQGMPPVPPSWGTPGPVGFYPLDVNRIVLLTFSLFRFRRATFIAIALAFAIPISIANGLLQAFTIGSVALSSQEMMVAVARGEAPFSALFTEMPWDAILISWIISSVLGLVVFVGVGAVTHAAGRAFAGSPISLGGSVRAALAKFVPLAAAYVISFLVTIVVLLAGAGLAGGLLAAGSLQSGLFAFLGILVFVAVGAIVVFLGVRWAMTSAAVMLEDAGGAAALGRSWRLVSGSSWRVLGYSLLFGFLVGVPLFLLSLVVSTIVGSGIEQTPVGLVANPAEAFLGTFILGALSAILAPITTIAATILYFDLRFRRGERAPVPGEPAPSVPEQEL